MAESGRESEPYPKNAAGPAPQPGYVYYAPPPPPPQKWWNRKRFSIVEMLALLLFAFLFFSPVTFMFLMSMTAPDPEFTTLLDGDYVLGNGTHAGERVGTWYGNEIRVHVNVTSGNSIDVFVMTESQYRGFLNNSEAIGYMYAVKNVGSADFTELSNVPCYVVLDNSDIPVLSDDSVPVGDVTVHLNIESKEPVFWD